MISIIWASAQTIDNGGRKTRSQTGKGTRNATEPNRGDREKNGQIEKITDYRKVGEGHIKLNKTGYSAVCIKDG